MESDQCVSCANYLGLLSCKAFPRGIPQAILEGSFDHADAYDGDGGVRYEPLEEAAVASALPFDDETDDGGEPVSGLAWKKKEGEAAPTGEPTTAASVSFVPHSVGIRLRADGSTEYRTEVANAETGEIIERVETFAPGEPSAPVTDVRPERSSTDPAPPEVVISTDAKQPWSAMLAPEGKATDDGRVFAPGSITWRDLPLTLMAMKETPGEGGHAGAFVAGRIDRIWRADEGPLPHWINGEGIFDDGSEGEDVARLVGDQTLRGNSVDLAIRRVEFGLRSLFVDENGVWRDDAPAEGEVPEPSIDELMGNADILMVVREATIGMSTVCPFPAFEGANIVLASGEDGDVRFALEQAAGGIVWKLWTLDSFDVGDVITASAAGLVPVKPPAEWFDDPELGELTPLTVTDDGRVFGHAWAWETCHIGIPGACTTAPHSKTDYAYFHLKEVETEDGGSVACGTITLGTGHADQRASRQAASEHYDHTGAAVADVVCGEDEFGGWIAGALRPDTAAGRVRELRGSVLSGDWRKVSGNLELVGLLAVNVPGFPVPRTRALVAAAAGDGESEVLALVAAGLNDRGVVEYVSAADRARLSALAARAEGGLEALADLATAPRPATAEIAPETAAVEWNSEEGVNDLMADIGALLNPGDSFRWYVVDVAIGGGSAIVCDTDDQTYWIVAVTIGGDGEPELAPRGEWVEVEQTWVEAQAGSALAAAQSRRLADLAARVS